jgi:hypothetical protein
VLLRNVGIRLRVHTALQLRRPAWIGTSLDESLRFNPFRTNPEYTHIQFCFCFTPLLNAIVLYVLRTFEFSHLFKECKLKEIENVFPLQIRETNKKI